MFKALLLEKSDAFTASVSSVDEAALPAFELQQFQNGVAAFA